MKDPLFSNKIAAAALTALLLIFGLPQLVNVFFATGGHGSAHAGDHGDDHSNWPFPQYPALDIGASSGGAAEEEAKPDLGTLLAAADAGRGARGIGLCKSCHTFDEGGATLSGPNLYDIVGREVASVGGFGYSQQLKDFGGTWTYERLDAFLQNSQALVPGGAMRQAVRKDNKRADMLAYLASLSANPVAFPAPAPVEAVVEEVMEHAEGEAH